MKCNKHYFPIDYGEKSRWVDDVGVHAGAYSVRNGAVRPS